MSLLIKRICRVGSPCIITFLLLAAGAAAQNTINVPGDQPTIQGAIGVANNGDTVLVAPGTYTENINFSGKAITVTSSGGAAVTTIDGGAKASVVIFNTGEGQGSVLNGFTIQNGSAAGTSSNPNLEGGGIYIRSTSPKITNNIIQNNKACSDGGGIAVNSGSPLIQGNTIQNNTQSGCSGGSGGGGIELGGAGSGQILGNVIINNTWPSGNGGGISMNAAGTPTISNNTIYGNTATGVSPAARGGGISTINSSDAIITQNLIYNNTAGQGANISLSVPFGDPGPIVVSNTVYGGTGATQGPALYITGFDNQVQISNNLFVGTSGADAVYCDGTYSQQPPVLTNNDAFLSGGVGFDGTCASLSGQNGNISVDPQFVNAAAGNFQVQTTSPAIDAGNNSAPKLPQTDFAANPRVLDGNNDCVKTVDLGVYELVRTENVSFSTSLLNFPNQQLGIPSSPLPVTLSNSGTGCYFFSSTTISGDFSQTNTCSSVGLAGGSSCVYNVTFTPSATGARSGLLSVSGSDGIVTTSPTASLSGIGIDFSVGVSPSSINVKRGRSGTATVSVLPVGGTVSATVALTCTGPPTFATCALSPSSVVPGSSGASSKLTVTTSPRTPRGTFTLNITGSTGNAQHATTLKLTVN